MPLLKFVVPTAVPSSASRWISRLTVSSLLFCILSPVSLSQDKLSPPSPAATTASPKPTRPTYTPGKEKREIQTPDLRDNADNEPFELQEEPKGQANPFLPPDLEDLVEKQISEDVWEGLKGELPCVQATTECVNQLQNAALNSSKLGFEVQWNGKPG